MRWSLILLALATVGCGPTGPHWVGENLHAVDGYWVGTETPCLPVRPDCKVDVEAAIRALPDADKDLVVGASLAGYPSGYVDETGQTILVTTAGLSQPSIVVLDLADGRRRVVMLACMGPITTGGGGLVEAKTCRQQEFANLRVGQRPDLGG